MDERSLRYEGWRVAIAGGVGVFLASLFVYTFGIFLRPLSEEFGWSREAISSAYGALAVVAALCAVPLGYLFDRVQPKAIIVPSLVIAACAFGSLAFLTSHLWHLYALFAVLGVAGLGTSAMAYSRAVSSWFERRRGMALALVVSGGSIGALVHPPLAELMFRWIGWRGTSLAFGLLVVAVGVPTVAALVRERPATTVLRNAVETPGAPLSEGLASRVFWIQMLVLFCSSIAQNAAIVHLVPLLTDRGVSASQAAAAMSAMGGAGLAGRLATGWLLDRVFAPYVSFVLVTIAALGTFLLAGAQSMAVGALAAMCIGFGMGGESDVTPYLISRYFGLRSFATLYGFTWMATGVAAAVGPILMGRAFDATGSYESLLIPLALTTAASGALMLWMPAYDSFRRESVAQTERAGV